MILNVWVDNQSSDITGSIDNNSLVLYLRQDYFGSISLTYPKYILCFLTAVSFSILKSHAPSPGQPEFVW